MFPVVPRRSLSQADRRCSRRSSDLAALSCPEWFAKLPLQNLSAGVARQCFDEIDGPRALVGSELLAAKGDDLLRRRLLGRDDDGLDRLSPTLVGDSDDGGVEDRRMIKKHPFDLGAVNVLAAGDDHVLEPVLDVDESVRVDAAE